MIKKQTNVTYSNMYDHSIMILWVKD